MSLSTISTGATLHATWGHFLASAEDYLCSIYGADKLWVVLELIPIQVDLDSDGD